MKYLVLLFVNISLVFGLAVKDEQINQGQSHRDERLLFKIVRITPETCHTEDSLAQYGTCMSKSDCTNKGGVGSGTCARGFGVCCLIQRSCTSSTDYNNTHFVNPTYPSIDTGYGACVLTVDRVNADICQMRFDFLDLQLSQPDVKGVCGLDFLTVTGGSRVAPTICGSNTGHHLYVDVDPNGGAVRLSVDRTAGSMSARRWNVKVTQIACTSPYRAPPGCAQFFTETSGTVQSFNFNQDVGDKKTQVTRQLANMDYAVCMKGASGYCGITWTRNITGGAFGFSVSEAADAIAPSLIGTPDAATTGAVRCTQDHVVIPGGVDDNGRQADRFCGLGFPNSVSTTSLPFILFVKTNDGEDEDTLNRGFSLDYRQTIC